MRGPWSQPHGKQNDLPITTGSNSGTEITGPRVENDTELVAKLASVNATPKERKYRLATGFGVCGGERN